MIVSVPSGFRDALGQVAQRVPDLVEEALGQILLGVPVVFCSA
ncbi:MAG TPA: hypothetical protein VEZ16_09440 [Microvirga sp.]|nr:hypothetical protein [Microvirga sp.]